MVFVTRDCASPGVKMKRFCHHRRGWVMDAAYRYRRFGVFHLVLVLYEVAGIGNGRAGIRSRFLPAPPGGILSVEAVADVPHSALTA